tara:strand:+ start:2214 stop:2456 length:243 start_codon:yes stop_codon:yes gene_type:complete
MNKQENYQLWKMNKEKHYELWTDFEALDVLKYCLTKSEYIGFLKGNILKYKLRSKGQDLKDEEKIKNYTIELNKLLNKLN